MRYLILAFLMLVSIQFQLNGQAMTSQLYETYEQFKEPSLKKRRIKHRDIQPLIQEIARLEGVKVQRVAHSIQGRSISLISIGEGPIDVFLWSQMHGDEPTATMAIFDILNFLESDQFSREKQRMLQKVSRESGRRSL